MVRELQAAAAADLKCFLKHKSSFHFYYFYVKHKSSFFYVKTVHRVAMEFIVPCRGCARTLNWASRRCCNHAITLFRFPIVKSSFIIVCIVDLVPEYRTASSRCDVRIGVLRIGPTPNRNELLARLHDLDVELGFMRGSHAFGRGGAVL